MKKDFSEWHKRKSDIHNGVDARPFFHEREIWWRALGANVGYEQDGKGTDYARPIVVVKKFNKEVFWAVPLTTKPKDGRFYFPVDLGDGRERRVILSQLRLVDAKRLRDKFAVVSEPQFRAMKKAITALFG